MLVLRYGLPRGQQMYSADGTHVVKEEVRIEAIEVGGGEHRITGTISIDSLGGMQRFAERYLGNHSIGNG